MNPGLLKDNVVSAKVAQDPVSLAKDMSEQVRLLRLSAGTHETASIGASVASSSTGVIESEIEGDTLVTIDEPLESSKPKKIGFSSIEVREYPIVVGDNPSVLSGVPLTIDWEYQSVNKLSVDDYENGRPPRRNKLEMTVPPAVREEILLSSGIPRGEVKEVIRRTNVDRNRRRRTCEMLHFSRLEMIGERVRRGLRNNIFDRQKAKEERSYVREARSITKNYITAQNTATQMTKKKKTEQVVEKVAPLDNNKKVGVPTKSKKASDEEVRFDAPSSRRTTTADITDFLANLEMDED